MDGLLVITMTALFAVAIITTNPLTIAVVGVATAAQALIGVPTCKS